MERLLGLCEFPPVCLGIAAESFEELPLACDGALDDVGRGIESRGALQGIGEQVLGLAPAVDTVVLAHADARRHLDAPVRPDAVEPLLVAGVLVQEGLLRPVADLHCAVAACEDRKSTRLNS